MEENHIFISKEVFKRIIENHKDDFGIIVELLACIRQSLKRQAQEFADEVKKQLDESGKLTDLILIEKLRQTISIPETQPEGKSEQQIQKKRRRRKKRPTMSHNPPEHAATVNISVLAKNRCFRFNSAAERKYNIWAEGARFVKVSFSEEADPSAFVKKRYCFNFVFFREWDGGIGRSTGVYTLRPISQSQRLGFKVNAHALIKNLPQNLCQKIGQSRFPLEPLGAGEFRIVIETDRN